MTAIPYLLQGENIILVLDGVPETISTEHLNYKVIREAIKAGDWETVRNNVSITKVIENFSEGRVEIKDSVLFFDNEEVHNALSVRMINMLREGFPLTPMVRFMENLSENTSYRAINELYGFLEKNSLPITEDGHFLAYKKVRGDYLDVYSGTVKNKPYDLWDENDAPYTTVNGVSVSVSDEKQTVISMARAKVDDNRDNTCSRGLHFCSIDYLAHFGGEKLVVLKINPKDVVSIPSDYNNAKGRCSSYIVLSEMEVPPEHAFTRSVQNDTNVPGYEYYDNYEDDYEW